MEASQIQHGEPRRLVMSAPTPLRQDFDASQVRGLARKTKDGPQARRLLALAAIYDGATRAEAAKIGGVGLQIIRDWVLRFNARGPDGLLDGKSTGQPSKLNDTQRQAIARMIESGPLPAVHGVVRWRLIDLAQWIFEEFQPSRPLPTPSSWSTKPAGTCPRGSWTWPSSGAAASRDDRGRGDDSCIASRRTNACLSRMLMWLYSSLKYA
jgi:transposase